MTAERGPRRRPIMRILVWLTFLWLAVLAGFFIWAARTHGDTERQVPELVAAVDDAMRSASSENPDLLRAMVATNMLASFDESGATDVFSLVPEVRGAKPLRFSVSPEGAAIFDYRGTSLATDVCVRSVLSTAGTVSTERWSCTDW